MAIGRYAGGAGDYESMMVEGERRPIIDKLFQDTHRHLIRRIFRCSSVRLVGRQCNDYLDAVPTEEKTAPGGEAPWERVRIESKIDSWHTPQSRY